MAAEVLAICMRESTPSCIRAPPDVQTSTSGIFLSCERRASRAIFSPTTEPIEPPMKAKFMTPRWSGSPSSLAAAGIDGVGVARLLPGRGQAIGVVLEMQRVGGAEVGVQLAPGALIGEELDVLLRR